MKSNKALLSEELKRHMRLVEYTFYVGEDEDVVGNSDNEKDLILGEDPEEDDMNLPDGDTEVADEPMDDPAAEPEMDPAGDIPAEEPMTDPAADPAMGGGMPAEPMADPAMNMAPAEDEVELDVTQLVQSSEDAKMSADMTNQKMSELMQHFNQLNARLNQLQNLEGKIEELENEIIKRNPTEVEQLEMRSLDSFPYNLKLTDYWNDKEAEGHVKATGNPIDTQEKPEEFELTQQDVDSEFNQQQIPRTFDMDNEDDELDKFQYFK